MSHKVFISYDHSEDARYKHLLQGWSNHPNFDFEFDNRSVKTPINSEDASRVKAGITIKLKQATHLFVIVGKLSYTSDWINWEIEKAKELGLKLAAVKIDRANNSPAGLLGVGTSWATSFTEKQIIEALNGAVVGYE
ncbi:TIR domain-containing protein [Psychrobacter immobilis]|uniref:TIR domain-containing protein n=1 Tax=Psychrobacter immobilis TaxID=498 RepID=UPI00191A58C5|nr:TIR domain-containing protein [Psychrobacter immobilis]